jgi:hypothetical protein
MIKYILIITIIAALVPTAIPNGLVSAATERGLFSGISFESGDPGTLRITEVGSGGETKEMALKAENEDGESRLISDFEITADNVLSINLNDEVRVHTDDNVDFTKALVTDSTEKKKTIDISDSGEISFNGYKQGVYVLNVVIDDKFAFEAIIVIGPETQQIINREITRVNNKQVTDVDVEIIFSIDEPEPDPDPVTPPVTPPITPRLPYPYCDLVPDNYKGSCHDRKDYDEDTLLYPCRDGSNVKDWRDCKDAGKHPDEQIPTPITPNALARSIPLTPDLGPEIDCEVQPELCETEDTPLPPPSPLVPTEPIEETETGIGTEEEEIEEPEETEEIEEEIEEQEPQEEKEIEIEDEDTESQE